MTDIEIIQLINQGDRNLYRVLVERYQQMVFRTAMGFLHNKDDADDLTQDVFIQAYQSLATFKGNSTFATWLYRITINLALNKVRKTAKSNIFQRLGSVFGSEKSKEYLVIDNNTDDPEETLIKTEHQQYIQNALNSLPPNQQTAIVLSKYDDLPQKEIAEIMNITEGAVEALIQRAKAKLREKLLQLQKKK